MSFITACPACGSSALTPFFELKNLPVHSMLLLPDKQEAFNFPKGDIKLAFCQRCGFITNLDFDPAMMEYSPNYESSQAFSPRFNAFAEGLASSLVKKYQLQGKDIVEIGCGGGDFLALMCKFGVRHGVGIDPAAGVGREDWQDSGKIKFVREPYSEGHASYLKDMALCRHTLEHIWDTGQFVDTLRRSLGSQKWIPVVFELPDATRVLRDIAFWDIYYEHCSYFSAGALAHLFAAKGFDVCNVSPMFDNQYLLLESFPGNGASALQNLEDRYLEQMQEDVAYFTNHYPAKLQRWRDEIQKAVDRGQRCVVWGGGSKGVAFLNTLGIGDEVDCVVDINPMKQNMYVAGTGHQIVGPECLRKRKPDLIMVMNPIYQKEIGQQLQELGVKAQLLAV